MKAIILAAGEGTRPRPHTRSRPKCLVELGGHPLLSYQLAALRGAGVNDITIVTGYLREQIEAYGLATRSAFDAAHNPRYNSTNMVARATHLRQYLTIYQASTPPSWSLEHPPLSPRSRAAHQNARFLAAVRDYSN